MALVNLSEAARIARKDRSTIHRKIKDGTLSATIDEAGNKAIDTAELQRVFGTLHASAKQQEPSGASVAQAVDPTGAELVAALKKQVQDAEARELWLRQRLDEAEAARRDLQLKLLPAPASPAPASGTSWESAVRFGAVLLVVAAVAALLLGAR